MKPKFLPAKYLSLLLLSFVLCFTKGFSQETMRSNLYVVLNGTPTLIDGNLTIYNNNYSNAVDWNDAQKLSNFGENFGIIRSSTTLVIERRQVVGISDTSTFMMWNMQQRTYQVQFNLQNLNHPGLFAKLVDNYLNTSTEICTHGYTAYNFQVTSDPASAQINRFKLIYYMNPFGTIPVDFNGIEAFRKEDHVKIHWQVENEISIDHYAVERSSDGINFTEITRVQPLNNGTAKSYEAQDYSAPITGLFYRVRAETAGGKIQYSAIALVDETQRLANVEIYPNPVLNQRIQLRLTNMEGGEYTVNLVTSSGRMIQLPTMRIEDGNSAPAIHTGNRIHPGIYQLIITSKSGGYRVVKTVNIL